MIVKNKKNIEKPDKKDKEVDEIQKEILSTVSDSYGIVFDDLAKKVSEKLKIQGSKIDEYIINLIAKGRIYWERAKLYKTPSTTHPPSF